MFFLDLSFCSAEIRDYWLKRSPTLFQQVRHPNLCATLLQKNDVDRLRQNQTLSSRFDRLIRHLGDDPTKHKSSIATDPSVLAKDHMRNVKSVQQLTLNNVQIPNENDIIRMPEISAADTLDFDIEKLKQSIESGLQTEQQLNGTIAQLAAGRATTKDGLIELGVEKKIKERTQILLENPAVNVEKMKEVLRVTETRIAQLAVQWEAHRAELVGELELANSSMSSQNVSRIIFNLCSAKFQRFFRVCWGLGAATRNCSPNSGIQRQNRRNRFGN